VIGEEDSSMNMEI